MSIHMPGKPHLKKCLDLNAFVMVEQLLNYAPEEFQQ